MPLFRWIDAQRLQDTLVSIQTSLTNINRRLISMATSIDDLNAAVTDLTTASANYTAAVSAEIAAIQAANQSGANDAAIETSAANIKALTDSFNTATAAAQAAVTPAA